MPRGAELPGAVCAELLPIAVDHYLLDTEDYFARKIGQKICSRCVVMMDCRLAELQRPTQERGVVGGVTAHQIRRARQWQFYEEGLTDTAPPHERPDWLPMSERAHLVESLRVDCDQDEGGEWRVA